jgi:hypothetical protein
MALPFEANIAQLGFTPEEIGQFSPNVRNLTKGNLIALLDQPQTTATALGLSVSDLSGLTTVVSSRLKATGGGPAVNTGGGGSGDGGIRCCCCIACCCCCCAVSVDQANAVA